MKARSTIAIGVLCALVGSLVFVSMARGSDHRRLRATLDGDNEVCAVANCNDPDGTGAAVVRMDPANDRICFTIRWNRIGSPYAAHIHRGAAGEEGPVRVTLFTARNLSRSVRKIGGCALNVSDALMNQILDHPRRFYVNVHTPRYEGGAIRGQLHQ